jgi:hypothetical protein
MYILNQIAMGNFVYFVVIDASERSSFFPDFTQCKQNLRFYSFFQIKKIYTLCEKRCVNRYAAYAVVIMYFLLERVA